MHKIKVMTVVGTRPEIIRLSRVVARLHQVTNHILVHTGQNYDYELNQVFFNELGLPDPDYYLDASKKSALSAIGSILENIEPVIQEEKPDAFLVLGDTNSCLAAIAARKYRIPIFHMEAGNRCFDLRVPEESNRRVVDHLSDINMPYSDHAREYLIREGISPQNIIKTGSPMYEVLHHYMDEILASSILDTLKLEQGKYFVVSAHREENIESEDQFLALINTLNDVVDRYSLPVLFSTHPRTRNRFERSGISVSDKVIFHKPLGLFDYVHLQKNAFMVLSDSGTITEESSILSFPAVNLRQSHERPEGMEESTVIMAGLSSKRVLQAIDMLQSRSAVRRLVSDYSMPNVSEKVCEIILSHIDYVRRVQWYETAFTGR